MVLNGLGLDQFLAMSLELYERPGFIGGHEAAIADNIGSQNRGESPFRPVFGHGMPPDGNL
jgi:hypothetical protein